MFTRPSGVSGPRIVVLPLWIGLPACTRVGGQRGCHGPESTLNQEVTMTVGLPIQRRAVGETPIWVGESRVPPVRGSGSNGSKIPSPMGSLAALLGDSPAMKGLRER